MMDLSKSHSIATQTSSEIEEQTRTKIKREIRGVIAQMKYFGYEGSVILLPAMLPDDEAEAIYEMNYRVEKRSPSSWWMRSKRTDLADPERILCKVTRKGKRITGTCKSYENNRPGACQHTAYYCRKNGLPVPGPYILARRLEPYQIYHSHKSAHAAHDEAQKTTRDRSRDYFFDLCRTLRDPNPNPKVQPGKRGVGQARIPFRAKAYAFLVKVGESLSFKQLVGELRGDHRYAALTGDRSHYEKSDPISDEALSQILATWGMLDALERMVPKSARLGQKMDRVMHIDSTCHGTTKLQNWFQKRYASGSISETDEIADHETEKPKRGRPKKTDAPRKNRGEAAYVRAHTVGGAMSGLIYAVKCTLAFGAGTHDKWQFESTVRAAMHKYVRMVVADKAYWDDELFGLMQRLNRLLLIPIKANIEPANADAGREMIAFIEYLRVHHPAIFRTFYRYRQSIEGIFSAEKRTTGYARTRLRRFEKSRVNRTLPPTAAELKAAIGAPAVRLEAVPTNYKAVRETIMSVIALEMVARAQACEIFAMAIALNARQLVEWECQYGMKLDLFHDEPLEPMRRVHMPWVEPRAAVPAA
jgi:hypothetical protein